MLNVCKQFKRVVINIKIFYKNASLTKMTGTVTQLYSYSKVPEAGQYTGLLPYSYGIRFRCLEGAQLMAKKCKMMMMSYFICPIFTFRKLNQTGRPELAIWKADLKVSSSCQLYRSDVRYWKSLSFVPGQICLKDSRIGCFA